MAVAAQERGLLVDGEWLQTGEWREVRSPMHAVRGMTEEHLVVIAA